MTDGVFLPWDVLAGLLIAAALTGVAGHLTGALWYTRKQFDRHKTMLFDDKVGAIPVVKRELEAKISAVAAQIEAIEVPDYTAKFELLEERVAARMTAAMDAKWGALQEGLSTRMGQVVQANIASGKAAMAREMQAVSGAIASEDGGMLGEIMGMFFDEETAGKAGKAMRLYRRVKAQGGGKLDLKSLMGGGVSNNGGGQLPPVGTIQADARGQRWLFTGDPGQGSGGWVMVQQQAPPTISPPILPAAAPAATAPADMPPVLPPEGATK